MFIFIEFYCFSWKMFGYQTCYNSIDIVLWSNLSEMFIFTSSSCKFGKASVSCFLFFTSCGVDGLGSPRSIVIKHGWWSDICLVKILDVPFVVFRNSLFKKLSINIPLLSDSLVGRVILGKKDWHVIVSKKSPIFCFVFIFNKSML